MKSERQNTIDTWFTHILRHDSSSLYTKFLGDSTGCFSSKVSRILKVSEDREPSLHLKLEKALEMSLVTRLVIYMYRIMGKSKVAKNNKGMWTGGQWQQVQSEQPFPSLCTGVRATLLSPGQLPDPYFHDLPSANVKGGKIATLAADT